jgi:hypothetical protein
MSMVAVLVHDEDARARRTIQAVVPIKEDAMVTVRARAFLVAISLAVITSALLVRAQDEFDFAIAPKFLEQLDAGHPILPSFRIHIDARSDIKDVGQDCEVQAGKGIRNRRHLDC